MEIVLSDSIKTEFKEMILALHNRKYFGTLELAENYVSKILNFILTIPTLNSKVCKTPKYGKFYARYNNPKSKMQYFITYNIIDKVYYIEHIISPKTKEYTSIMGL